MTEKQVVFRVEDDMNREDIHCTTYQMRNFYAQFRDGFFSHLDVMNYIQHHKIAKWAKAHDQVLDICCGRGLLLPLLRYHRKSIDGYTGVDIAPNNAKFMEKRVTDGKPLVDLVKEDEKYYPFPVQFVESDVAKMSEVLPADHFTFLVFTSSIEHMHKDAGQQALHEARKVAKQGARMILTCPNTPEDKDGYDTRYRAHVYEWKRSELNAGLEEAGWKIMSEWGLTIGYKEVMECIDQIDPSFSHQDIIKSMIETFDQFIPREWWLPMVATLFPSKSSEIGFIAEAV